MINNATWVLIELPSSQAATGYESFNSGTVCGKERWCVE